MNIKSKVLIAPGLLLILLMVECAFGWYALNTQKSSLREIVDVRNHAVLNAYKFIDGIDRVHLQTYRYFSWLGNADDVVIQKLASDLKQQIGEVVAELKNVSSEQELDGPTKNTMAVLLSNVDGYVKSVSTALDMSEVDAATGKQMLQASDDEFKKLRSAITTWSEKEGKSTTEAYFAALGVHDKTLKLGAILALASIVIGIGVSLRFANLITRPLLDATNVAQELAEGRIRNIKAPKVTDEASALLNSLATTSAKLGAVVAKIHHTADEVVRASDGISKNSFDLSTRTEQTAAALEETSASMDQLASTIEETARNAKLAAETATVANDLAMRK